MSSSPPADYVYELYRLEYERAAERYENIYQAIWQNFSYMAALAGGILAFGSNALPLALAAAIALVPLVFWFWATFIPMNFYGEQIRKRLAVIEGNLNTTYLQGLAPMQQLQHFREFSAAKVPWRVRNAVRVFGVLISLAWVGSVACAVREGVTRKPESDPQRIEIVSPVRIQSEAAHAPAGGQAGAASGRVLPPAPGNPGR